MLLRNLICNYIGNYHTCFPALASLLLIYRFSMCCNIIHRLIQASCFIEFSQLLLLTELLIARTIAICIYTVFYKSTFLPKVATIICTWLYCKLSVYGRNAAIFSRLFFSIIFGIYKNMEIIAPTPFGD